MLAKAFKKFYNNDDVLIFASGVSNSLEIDPAKFEREKKLLELTISELDGKLLVYFSTCSMYDKLSRNSMYVKHKLLMEDIIKQECPKFLILRVSQIIGMSDNDTLVNLLFRNVLNYIPFNIWANSTRNLIAIDDVVSLTELIIVKEVGYNRVYHLANSHYISPLKLLQIIEEITEIDACHTLIDDGVPYDLIPNDIENFLINAGIKFDENYYKNNLQKFYDLKMRVSPCI